MTHYFRAFPMVAIPATLLSLSERSRESVSEERETGNFLPRLGGATKGEKDLCARLAHRYQRGLVQLFMHRVLAYNISLISKRRTRV